MKRLTGSLSIDLDNLWSYLKTHGDPDWESYPSYLPLVVPRILRFLAQRKQSATFFVVGKDLESDENRVAIQSIADAGHEIGNHSFQHEPWLHLYSRQELEQEIDGAHRMISELIEQEPIGFRGPGFSYSADLIEVLAERGYQYDASTFPTFLGPLARAYYFFKSRLDRQQRSQRKQLFGKFSNGFRSNRPYYWQINDHDRLLEIPVTTMPVLRVPIHMSYLIYLGSFSRSVASLYHGLATGLCRWTRTPPSMLLHPLDFLDLTDEPRLEFFPGIKMPWERKVKLISNCLDAIERRFDLVPLAHQATLCGQRTLSSRNVEFVRVATPSS